MAPVPIYTQSPIHATKPSGVTPQTAAPADGSPEGSQAAAAATTTTQAPPAPGAGAAPQNSYPPARPGAAPSLPAPTGAAASSRRYAPVQPTPTVKEAADGGPPPPQPGAVPRPAGGAAPTLPPPPKAGEKYQAPIQTPAPQMPSGLPYPPQMGIPSPATPPNQRGTAAATAAQQYVQPQLYQPAGIGGGGGLGGLGGGLPPSGNGVNPSHPPGYHQNVHASDFNSSQAAHLGRVSSERRRGGISEEAEDEEDEGVWDAAKKFLASAGQKLSEAESEVWRRINKD